MSNESNIHAGNSNLHFIQSLADLQSFRDSVNRGEDFRNIVVVQSCDLSGLKNWTPIGTMEHPFRGIYKAKGTTIAGITVHAEGIAGLFGCVEGGTVEGVKIISGSIAGNKAGGICGLLRSGGTLIDCSNAAIIQGVGNAAFIGGICGDLWGTVSLSTNSGAITNDSDGLMKLTGGIAGACYEGCIEDCVNEGAVRAAAEYSGGICASNNKGVVKNCHNKGSVAGSIDQGGICGWNNGVVTNCKSDEGKLIGNGLSAE